MAQRCFSARRICLEVSWKWFIPKMKAFLEQEIRLSFFQILSQLKDYFTWNTGCTTIVAFFICRDKITSTLNFIAIGIKSGWTFITVFNRDNHTVIWFIKVQSCLTFTKVVFAEQKSMQVFLQSLVCIFSCPPVYFWSFTGIYSLFTKLYNFTKLE